MIASRTSSDGQHHVRQRKGSLSSRWRVAVAMLLMLSLGASAGWTPGDENGLMKSTPTIAEFLQKNGYGTYFSGSVSTRATVPVRFRLVLV
jgi:arylsulfatase A-like enzyme